MNPYPTKPCPNCFHRIYIDSFRFKEENRYTPMSEQIPVGGYCVNCGHRWEWDDDGIIEGYYLPAAVAYQERYLISTKNCLFIGIIEEEV